MRFTHPRACVYLNARVGAVRIRNTRAYTEYAYTEYMSDNERPRLRNALKQVESKVECVFRLRSP